MRVKNLSFLFFLLLAAQTRAVEDVKEIISTDFRVVLGEYSPCADCFTNKERTVEIHNKQNGSNKIISVMTLEGPIKESFILQNRLFLMIEGTIDDQKLPPLASVINLEDGKVEFERFVQKAKLSPVVGNQVKMVFNNGLPLRGPGASKKTSVLWIGEGEPKEQLIYSVLEEDKRHVRWIISPFEWSSDGEKLVFVDAMHKDSYKKKWYYLVHIEFYGPEKDPKITTTKIPWNQYSDKISEQAVESGQVHVQIQSLRLKKGKVEIKAVDAKNGISLSGSVKTTNL